MLLVTNTSTLRTHKYLLGNTCIPAYQRYMDELLIQKCFFRSMKLMDRDKEFSCALLMMDCTAKLCSMHPLIPLRKLFCSNLSMMEFDRMYFSILVAIIL